MRGVLTTLEGWVAGDDHEVTVRVGDDVVTTTVVDGVATQERNGTITEVPASTAAAAPAILDPLGQVTVIDNGIRGRLGGGDVGQLGFDVNGSVVVAVATAGDGTLTGYKITANNDSWSIVMAFTP